MSGSQPKNPKYVYQGTGSWASLPSVFNCCVTCFLLGGRSSPRVGLRLMRRRE